MRAKSRGRHFRCLDGDIRRGHEVLEIKQRTWDVLRVGLRDQLHDHGLKQHHDRREYGHCDSNDVCGNYHHGVRDYHHGVR